MSNKPFEIQLVSRKKGKLIVHNSKDEMDILLAQLEEAQEAFSLLNDDLTFHKNVSAAHAANVDKAKNEITRLREIIRVNEEKLKAINNKSHILKDITNNSKKINKKNAEKIAAKCKKIEDDFDKFLTEEI